MALELILERFFSHPTETETETDREGELTLEDVEEKEVANLRVSKSAFISCPCYSCFATYKLAFSAHHF